MERKPIMSNSLLVALFFVTCFRIACAVTPARPAPTTARPTRPSPTVHGSYSKVVEENFIPNELIPQPVETENNVLTESEEGIQQRTNEEEDKAAVSDNSDINTNIRVQIIEEIRRYVKQLTPRKHTPTTARPISLLDRSGNKFAKKTRKTTVETATAPVVEEIPSNENEVENVGRYLKPTTKRPRTRRDLNSNSNKISVEVVIRSSDL